MFAAGLVTFRETLEAALVIGIILSFLTRTHQEQFKKYIWVGVSAGILISIGLSFVLQTIFGGFTGRIEEIFEGVLMLLTAGFLTWMILWVHRQRGIVEHLESQVSHHIATGFPLGLIFLTLTSVLREGVETVLYLRAISILSGGNQLLGAILGILVALSIGYAIFRFSLRINLSRLLKISAAILLLFGAGLVAHGVHEFQEAGLLPIFSFDPLINIAHILDHKSIVGSILRVLFGYTAKPTLLELVSYGAYVFLIFLLEVFSAKYLYLQRVKIRK